MPVFRSKMYSPTYSNIAWWLVPLAVAIGLALLCFCNADKSPAKPVVLARPSPDTELVALAPPPLAAATTSDRYPDFIPPDGLLQQKVLEHLRRFQTEFRQMAPGASVSSARGSKNRELVAHTLADFFASADLAGSAGAPTTIPLPETVAADVLLYTRKENREIALRFLAAISPYLSGGILLVFDQRFNLDRLHLMIRGTPRFKADGSVVFPAEPAGQAQADGGEPGASPARSVEFPD